MYRFGLTYSRTLSLRLLSPRRGFSPRAQLLLSPRRSGFSLPASLAAPPLLSMLLLSPRRGLSLCGFSPRPAARLNSNPYQESASSQIRQNRRRQLLLWTPQKTLHLVHSYTTFCSPNPRSESESPRRPGCYGLRISRTRKRPLRVRTRSLKPRRVTWSRAPTVASRASGPPAPAAPALTL